MENCERWAADRVDWQKVVIFRTKKGQLRRPDHWKTWMWKNEKLDRNNRQGGGGSIMFCGMLFFRNKFCETFLTVYQHLLQNCAMSVIYDKIGDSFIFQQDNCNVQVSESIQKFFEEQGISRLN